MDRDRDTEKGTGPRHKQRGGEAIFSQTDRHAQMKGRRHERQHRTDSEERRLSRPTDQRQQQDSREKGRQSKQRDRDTSQAVIWTKRRQKTDLICKHPGFELRNRASSQLVLHGHEPRGEKQSVQHVAMRSPNGGGALPQTMQSFCER